jgi:hypothetical protein
MNFWRHNIYCLSMFIITFFFGRDVAHFCYIVFGGTLQRTYSLMGQIFWKA